MFGGPKKEAAPKFQPKVPKTAKDFKPVATPNMFDKKPEPKVETAAPAPPAPPAPAAFVPPPAPAVPIIPQAEPTPTIEP